MRRKQGRHAYALRFSRVPSGSDLQQHRLTNTIQLTLKMTFAKVVEKSVTNNNSSFQNYANDHCS